MSSNLKIHETPRLNNPTLVMGFSGWMNGGEVSTGTIEAFVEGSDFKTLATIDSHGYYIYNFPGTMEVTSIFRPHCVVDDGIIEEFDEPVNIFWVSEKHNLLLFLGQEPNINWVDYANCIFAFCAKFDVGQVICLGSVAGLIPHTREPRYFCTVSDVLLKHEFKKMGFKFSDYNGPASIITYLIAHGASRNLRVASIVAEIPAYIHGRNPKCIESMARRVSAVLGLGIEFPQMRKLGDELEKKLNEVISSRHELSNHIQRLEQDYDNEVFDVEMSDLKDWLQKQGIRLD